MFNLANDSYGGAAEFPLTGGGPLFYYPASDSSALSIDRDLVPIYSFYNPTYGDYLYTTDASEAQSFPCIPAHCVYVTPAGYCGVVAPPNCYLNVGVLGYGGN